MSMNTNAPERAAQIAARPGVFCPALMTTV